MDRSPDPARLPPPAAGSSERVLLLALDAVPLRVMQAACDAGAFTEWSAPCAVVAPFPSLTHPAFASLFEPFGVGPSWGYEVRYFDAAANRMAGGNPLTYRNDVPPWARLLDTDHHGVVAKGSNYVTSMRAALHEAQQVLDASVTSSREVFLGYLGSTDALMHLYGDDAVVELLVELDRRMDEIQRRHLIERGMPLRVGLYSDHGCGREPVHYTGDLRGLLRQAGLRVVERLLEPADVVAPTFGIVNYLALFLQDPDRIPAAAQALCQHPAVELAAWAAGGNRIDIVAPHGQASIHWRGTGSERTFAYRDEGGDVLGLGPAIQAMAHAGHLGPDGAADGARWRAATVLGCYPDPLTRLVDALAGDRIRSRATVLASLGPGWSWGWRSAFLGSLVRGGRLKGTHGGLDRESSLAFLTVRASDGASGPLPANAALAPFAAAVRADRAIDAHGPE